MVFWVRLLARFPSFRQIPGLPEGLKVPQSVILSGCARGYGAKVTKAVKVVILGVLARAKTEDQECQLSPRESSPSVNMSHSYLSLPDQCPIPSFTQLNLPGRILLSS